jgi:hypothetical protein
MSKILEASCVGEVVTVEGIPLENVEILSEGLGQSEGALLMEGQKKFYITSSASDLSSTIDQIVEGLNKTVEGLNAAGGALNGIAGGAGTSTIAAATGIAPIIAALNTLKGQLK